MLEFSDLKAPLDDGWELIVGFDTGTYMSAAFTVIPPDPYFYAAYTIAEFPNYRYVGGEIELTGESTPEWARRVRDSYRRFFPQKSKVHGWVDSNSQFKTELKRYNLALQGNPRMLELRVEVTREYVLNDRWFVAPWCVVLQQEMEWAKWPDDTTAAGKFVRLKHRDHTLDCVEHALSRRPRSKKLIQTKQESFKERFFREHQRQFPIVGMGDPHLGRN